MKDDIRYEIILHWSECSTSPGVITCGATLDEARSLLRGALADMAETNLLHGEPLPTPDTISTNDKTGFEEPIHLLLTASLPN